MGNYDDNIWDINPNNSSSTFLHRPRSRKSHTVNESMMNLFNHLLNEDTSKKPKKRSKTFHVYDMSHKSNSGSRNSSSDDFLDLLSRAKHHKQPTTGANQQRTPLKEINLNNIRTTSGRKSVDLLDLNQLSSQSDYQDSPSCLSSDPINLLSDKKQHERKSLQDTVEEVQDQISSVSLGTDNLNALDPRRCKTLPPLVSSHKDSESFRAVKSDGLAPNKEEETVADSEDEPEILSTSSDSKETSRSSTVSLNDQNVTMNTSIVNFHNHKLNTYHNDENVTDLLDANGFCDTQITGGNFQAEDLATYGESYEVYSHYESQAVINEEDTFIPVREEGETFLPANDETFQEEPYFEELSHYHESQQSHELQNDDIGSEIKGTVDLSSENCNEKYDSSKELQTSEAEQVESNIEAKKLLLYTTMESKYEKVENDTIHPIVDEIEFVPDNIVEPENNKKSAFELPEARQTSITNTDSAPAHEATNDAQKNKKTSIHSASIETSQDKKYTDEAGIHQGLFTILSNVGNGKLLNNEWNASEESLSQSNPSNIENKSKLSSSKDRKRKPSLADLCSKTNSAKVPYRVGLSKKIKVESLHNYLNR